MAATNKVSEATFPSLTNACFLLFAFLKCPSPVRHNAGCYQCPQNVPYFTSSGESEEYRAPETARKHVWLVETICFNRISKQTKSQTHSLTHSLTHCFTDLLTHSLAYLLTRSNTHSHTHSVASNTERPSNTHPLLLYSNDCIR